MPQEEYKDLLNKLDFFIKTLKSYDKVDATISKETINNVIDCIDKAQNVLEQGFINDACNEVEEVLNREYN